MGKWNIKQSLLLYKNQLIVVLTPLVCLPLPLVIQTDAALCGYVMLLMGTYWCTTALPIAVTSLLPVFLMPMLGLLSSDDTCKQYYKASAVLFLGGMMVAQAIEKSNLHRRVALAILMVVGTKPAWLLMGFMVATWFMSLWISNSASTSMMLPIMEAVLSKLENVATVDEAISKPTIDGAMQTYNNDAYTDLEESEPPAAVARIEHRDDNPVADLKKADSIRERNMEEDQESNLQTDPEANPKINDSLVAFSKAMTLSIAYSASIGGIGTLTGAPQNVIMKDTADGIWLSHGYSESPVNYATWMVFGFPLSLIFIVLAWMWLVVFYLGPKKFCVCGKNTTDSEIQIQKEIKQELVNLGSMTWAEWTVSLFFLLMVFLWFFRSPGFIKGWGDYFKDGYVKDSVVSVMVACVLFIIPYNMPHLIRKEYDSTELEEKSNSKDTLLDWPLVEHTFPWGVMLMLGGGSALAEACMTSGLSDWIGEQLEVFSVLPPYVMVSIVCLIAAFLTEVTSNTATSSIIMPIAANMAEGLGSNPLYLMFPTAVCCSLAFMLPAATAPNAIVFAYNRVTVLDMVKCGIMLKLLVLFPALAAQTWGYNFFDFGTIPWDTSNNTRAAL